MLFLLRFVIFLSCPWVNVNGTLYKEGFVVVRGVREDLPSFGRIEQIICVGTDIFFYLECLRTDGLDRHLNAFSVQPDLTACRILVPQHALITYEAVQEIPFEGGQYVILRSVQAWMD